MSEPSPAAEAAIRAAAARLAAAGESRPRAARDPVNLPMIRNWTEALARQARPGRTPDTAPPAMIQVWTMPGLHGVRADDDPLGQMSQVLDEAGYTSVVATNCDQAYHRYLKLGEQLSVRARLLGRHRAQAHRAGRGLVRHHPQHLVLGRRAGGHDGLPHPQVPPPGSATPATAPPAPAKSHQHRKPHKSHAPPGHPGHRVLLGRDRGRRAAHPALRRCGALRHPPGPMCPACGEASDGGYVVAAGTGEVFSYVVHHHPPVPGKRLPMVVALVQLPEGVRMVGEMPGVRPDQVRIGLPVRATFVRPDSEHPRT